MFGALFQLGLMVNEIMRLRLISLRMGGTSTSLADNLKGSQRGFPAIGHWPLRQYVHKGEYASLATFVITKFGFVSCKPWLLAAYAASAV